MILVKDIEHISKLACIWLSEDEKEFYARQLSGALEYAERINEVDTEGVEPTVHVLNLVNVLREDEVRNDVTREVLMSNASEVENGYFKVPKIN